MTEKMNNHLLRHLMNLLYKHDNSYFVHSLRALDYNTVESLYLIRIQGQQHFLSHKVSVYLTGHIAKYNRSINMPGNNNNHGEKSKLIIHNK